ncbi:titin [Holotrichia oblita]|uniref:Titin n=1 Tax=Holotrichia oblita TaxID=644536 RepID=A0ACB9TR75_HOLOL|nr:titin [Holotrichia oblita]
MLTILDPTSICSESSEIIGLNVLQFFLIYLQVRLEDRGVYICYANNSAGEETARITLEITAPLSVHVQPQVQVVDVGKTANFQCIINGYPISQITWMHNGKPVAPDSRVEVMIEPARLTIRNLNKEDRGMYQCFVSNNWDQGQATAELNMGDAGPELIYWFSEQTLQPGPSVSLKCVASGNPPPQFTWTLDGFTIPDHPRFLMGQYVTIQDDVISHVNISNIKAEDGGEYTCTAHNSVGKISHSARVNVFGIPFIRPMPKVTGVAGSNLVIKCPVAGYPIDTITWERDGQTLPMNRRQRVYTNGTLVVEQTQRTEDAGTYTCQAQNRQRNSARRDVQVQILGELLFICFKLIVVRSGDNERGTVGIVKALSKEKTSDNRVIKNKKGDIITDDDQIGDKCKEYFMELLDADTNSDAKVESTNQEMEREEEELEQEEEIPKEEVIVVINKLKTGKAAGIKPEMLKNMGEEGIKIVLELFRKIWKVTTRGMTLLSVVAKVFKRVLEYRLMEKTINLMESQSGFRSSIKQIIEKSLDQSQEAYMAFIDLEKSFDRIARVVRYVHALLGILIRVPVPPKILPINPMTDLLREGMRAAITCQIMEGDLPITFRFERNGKPVSNNVALGTVVRRIDEFSSSLIIDQVTSAHTGNYTCIASNVAGAEKYIVPLTVNVPPKWTVEPIDASAAAGQEAVLHCQAGGYPSPTITWRKAIGSQPGEYKDFLFEPHVHQYQNGTLSFTHVSKDNEGQYLCEAKNNIGSGVSKVIFLKVNGNNSLKRMFYTIHILLEGMVSELSIERTIRQDTTTFTCSATNAYGQDEMHIQLIVQEIPEAPRNVRVIEQLSRSIGLSWTLGFAGNSPINSYIVQYKLGTDAWPIQPLKVIVPGSQTSTTIPNLRPSQVYHIRILAENRLGLSEPSQVVQVSTLEEVPSGSPLDIRAEAKSSTEIVVTWEPPPRETWNGNLLGYHVGYQILSPDTQQSQYTFKSVEVRAHFGGEATLQGLSKYTPYNIIVQAYNSRGSGPSSNAVTARTLEDAPSLPPENIKCQVLSAQSVRITWEPPLPEGRNGKIQGYKVTYHSISEWFDIDDQETKMIQNQYTTLTGLNKYTNYSITALAFTDIGDGVRSDPIYCHTEEDVPSAPADIKALLSAPNKILVSWLPPKRGNGVLVAYTFYMSTLEDGREEGTHKRLLGPDTEMHEIDRMQPTATTCQFWVTASTKVGEGTSSRVVTVTLSKTIPARIASFGREILSAWKQDIYLPCRHVGLPSPTITWRVNDLPLEIGGRRSVTPNSTLIIKDVQSIDQANYSCDVENLNGKDEIVYGLKVLVPPEPPVLTIMDSFADSLHLKWNDQKNGGSPILGYVINYKRDHGDWEELQISARTDEYILRNLWCGTKYMLYITAFNRIGTGLPCDIVTAHTKGTVPVKPKQSQMLTMNATVGTVWLDSWGDGGCGILYFVIEYKSSRDPQWIVAANHIKPTERIFSVTDLWPATEYQFRVTAFNNAGETSATYNFSTLNLLGAIPEMSPPDSHSGDHPFANVRVLLPIILSLIILSALVATIFWRRKLRRDRENQGQAIGESPSMAQIQNKQNRDQQYLAARVGQRGQQQLPTDTDTYKSDSADYIEDICPYATFQLSKPAYSESSYSGNVYSGPYHSVRGSFVYHDVKPPPNDKFNLGRNKEHEYTKVRRKGGKLRDPHSESQESDNLGSTDSEVKKILTLHLPISEYDTLGSDSEGDGRATSQELMSFSHRMRGGAEGSSSSSETSPPSGSVGRKPYPSRKGKAKGLPLSKRHVRSSSGYSSHNDETTFSISHAPSFNERIHPPSRFSDLNPRDLSESDCDKGHKHTRGLSKLNREAFQINV